MLLVPLSTAAMRTAVAWNVARSLSRFAEAGMATAQCRERTLASRPAGVDAPTSAPPQIAMPVRPAPFAIAVAHDEKRTSPTMRKSRTRLPAGNGSAAIGSGRRPRPTVAGGLLDRSGFGRPARAIPLAEAQAILRSLRSFPKNSGSRPSASRISILDEGFAATRHVGPRPSLRPARPARRARLRSALEVRDPGRGSCRRGSSGRRGSGRRGRRGRVSTRARLGTTGRKRTCDVGPKQFPG